MDFFGDESGFYSTERRIDRRGGLISRSKLVDVVQVRKIDPRTGKDIWKQKVDGFQTLTWMRTDQLVLIKREFATLIDEQSGKIRGQAKFANPYDTNPYNQDDWKAVKDGRNIYYDFNGQLVVADRHEGILKMGEYYDSGIKDLVISDGRLYLATPDKLYCYDTD